MEQLLLDSLWILLAAALVFLMQPGFMCLESGLPRSKNSINVAIKNLADFVFAVLSFWAIGYGLLFCATAAGWIGDDSFFPAIDADPFFVSFVFFQAMFCGTAITIFSGAVAEQMRFFRMENDLRRALRRDELRHYQPIVDMNTGMITNFEVAEGVEGRAQFDRLKALACDYAQGYTFPDHWTPMATRTLIGKNFIENAKDM